VEAFRREGLIADGPPIVAVNQNSSDPHYVPTTDHNAPIRERDFVLLDVWGKKNTPGAVYYDISWTGFVGRSVPDRIGEIFDIVRRSRDAGVEKVTKAIASGQKLAGWEVDKAARDVLETAGYAKYLNNRVGHSIGTEVHGYERQLRIPRRTPTSTYFEFGLRSEVNMNRRKRKTDTDMTQYPRVEARSRQARNSVRSSNRDIPSGIWSAQRSQYASACRFSRSHRPDTRGNDTDITRGA
jgi:Xaa-Pro dipeptidase